MKGAQCGIVWNDDADDDENEEYQPARRRMRLHEPVASPVMSMSEHDETVFVFGVLVFMFAYWITFASVHTKHEDLSL